MKIYIAFFFIMCLVIIGACDKNPSSTSDSSDPVASMFPDSTLENLVRYAVDKPYGTITPADLDSLTRIWTVWPYFEYFGTIWRVSDLSGLEHATQLQVLLLQDGSVQDLQPLASLTQLEELRFPNHNIRDLNPLSELTELWSISLIGNQVVDLSPLHNLPNLRSVGFTGNNVHTLNPLSGMQNLRGIGAQANQLLEISGLSDLPALKSINLSYNQIEDITPLLNLTDWGGDCFVYLTGNPLNEASINEVIPALEAQGVNVTY